MEIPVCPACGGSAWSSTEQLSGGERFYELRAEGWVLVDESLEMLESDYCCRDCGHDPVEDDDDCALWDLLSAIDTAFPDDVRADRAG